MSHRYYDELPGHRTQPYRLPTFRQRAVSNYVADKYHRGYEIEANRIKAAYVFRMRQIDPYFAGGKPWKEPPNFKKTNFAYEDMIANEAILKDKQDKLRSLASEVASKRKAVVAQRLTYVNKGFKKPDGGPIRNQSLFTGQMNVNKGFISPGTVITFEKDNKFTSNKKVPEYSLSCNECLETSEGGGGECGSCDGCCNCICHKGTRSDYIRFQ